MAKKNLTEAAQAATAALFSNASDDAQTAQEGRQVERVSKSSGTKKDAQKGDQTAQTRRVTTKGKSKSDVKVFSFRSWIDEVEEWRLYAATKGMQIDELGAAAMREYIKRHPVTDEERQVQEAVRIVRDMKARKQNT